MCPALDTFRPPYVFPSSPPVEKSLWFQGLWIGRLHGISIASEGLRCLLIGGKMTEHFNGGQGVTMVQDRRRYARADLALDVTVEAPGSHWKGTTLKLSPYGVKVTSPAPPAPLPTGTSVQVWLHLGVRTPSLRLPASVVRTDPDSLALSFGRLSVEQSQRLRSLIDSLLLREWQESLNHDQVVSPAGGGTKGLWARVHNFIGLIGLRRSTQGSKPLAT